MTAAPETRETSPVIESLVTLHVPCKYRHLRMIRTSVTDLGKRAGLSDFQNAQLEMAVDEACTNVIEHSYGGERKSAGADHPGIRLNLLRCRDRIVVEIYDRGAGFTHARLKPVSPQEYLESSRQRGLGLFIIQKFVDDLQYKRSGPDGNCLRLTKYL